ncbi:DUF4149 domain-containing protein [Halobacterium noricense]|uniref:DUF4149 domain-containing protein n=1 Tax=Halobacterium noricense TaxID=223182 RepID=UPI001E32C2DA|nr:DUF4149 domain-containing protein [Halobacterium noricense]UHH26245.1 DUF4149 domain-containing protein [Halobacterium noricense]
MSLGSLVVHAALGMWLGSIVFFSFVAAPALFDELGEERAGDAVNVVFPRYYSFGIWMGTIVLVVWALGPTVADVAEPALVADVGVVAAFLANLYARYQLIPKMEAAGSDAFARYHKQSVGLNLVALAGLAAAFAVLHL